MTKISKVFYMGAPVKIEVHKPKYYYKDILVNFYCNQDYNIELVAFEGIEYQVTDYSISYSDKYLWNNRMLYRNEKCLAPVGETYFIVDNGNVIQLDGCLKDGCNDGSYAKYFAFAKDDNLILANNDEDIDGYTYAGEVEVLEHNKKNLYVKNYYEVNDKVSYTGDNKGNIWCSLNPNGELTAVVGDIFSFVPEVSFYAYKIMLKSKVTPVDTNGYRKLFMFDGLNWFGTSSGKLCIYDKLTASAALSSGITYWIKYCEEFDTGVYKHSIAYIADDNYDEENLPDDSLWTVKTVETTAPWITSSVKFIGLGADETNNRSWYGKVDLLNTKIERCIDDKSVDVLWEPFRII
ncbi:MAG: hypothetical protein IKW39_05430 [Alphaproteobacteria bacterium]|nr:hypothetical protein [Alphaproteobacteria bacterium]